MKMNKKGFTLIEMLAVIAIIAVLVAIIIPVIGNSTTKAAAAADAANLRSLTAEASINYIENNCEGLTDVDGYSFESKLWGEEVTIVFYEKDNTLIGTVTNSDDVCADVDYFATVAESGDEDDATGFDTTDLDAVVEVTE